MLWSQHEFNNHSGLLHKRTLVQGIVVVPILLRLRRSIDLPFFFLLLSIVVFLDGTRGPDAIVQRRVLHALDNGLPAGIDLLGVVGSKGRRNCRSVVHPAFELELSDNLVVSVGFCSALGDLISPDVGLVEIVDKVDGQLDQKVALHLGVVGVVEPVVKVGLGTEPEHGVSTVLDPKGLLPFLHDDRSKRNPRQNKALLADEVGLGKA